jgi:penicillin-binding protein A
MGTGYLRTASSGARWGAAEPRPFRHTRTRLRRVAPLLLAALAAFVGGAIVGSAHSSSGESAVVSFLAAWAQDDYSKMYSQLDATAQARLPEAAFAAAYRTAILTATATAIEPLGRPRALGDGSFMAQMEVRTRIFGTFRAPIVVPTAGTGGDTAIAWTPELVFPGLLAGERLTRRTALPRRAAILARNGSLLASGPALAGERPSPLGAAAADLIGSLGQITPARAQALEGEGVPSDAIVGTSGLELALDARLRGTAGGLLLAGHRVLASSTPHSSAPVVSSVSRYLQQVAVNALGGRLGGIVAMRPTGGEILAVAGLGLDGLQPPGSTFKIITLSGALSAGLAQPSTRFPYDTYATLDGTRLANANGESCGGSLQLAFAVSCNSVFAPLGARLGADRLVAMAQAFGFNQPPGIPAAAESTIPPPGGIQGNFALGATAIGQGQVLATPLEMAIAAATVADAGVRPMPTFTLGEHPAGTRAITAHVAHQVRSLMKLVVKEGTGVKAQIAGVSIAGKTGTAELANTVCPPAGQGTTGTTTATTTTTTGQVPCNSSQPNPANTDAWFTAFAPASRPRIVVAVLLVRDGAGGDTAAPVARQVLEAGLKVRY